MSYSRFGSSVWYTFWSSAFESETRLKLPTKKLKHQQVFEICDFPSYYITYGEIKRNGITKIIHEVREFYSKEHKKEGPSFLDKDSLGSFVEVTYSPKNPSIKELQELETYLYAFVDDVDTHFELFNFFYYEWYITIRNRIYWWYRDNIKNKLWPK